MTIIFTESDMDEVSYPPTATPVGASVEHPVETWFCGSWVMDDGES